MSTAAVPGIRYHFIITLQTRTGQESITNTASGVLEFPPGTSRASAYADIRARSREAMGPHWASTQNPVSTLFFSLEPDELPAPAALNGAEQ